eukprot:gene52740-71955_t
MVNEINPQRRRFFGIAAAGLAVAQFGLTGAAAAQTAGTQSGVAPSFGQLKQIDAGLLNVGYVEAGPANGAPAVLLHGWPYDIHAFAEVTPILAAAGYRVIVPHLRGHGTTRLGHGDARNSNRAHEFKRVHRLLTGQRCAFDLHKVVDWHTATAPQDAQHAGKRAALI